MMADHSLPDVPMTDPASHPDHFAVRFWHWPWLRRWLARAMFRRIPHGALLGAKVVDINRKSMITALPYQEKLIGNPETGFVHSGAVTVLIDQTCGAMASLAVTPPALVATLDLRLDWLRPATPGMTILARAECVSIKRQIVFMRCVAYQDDPDQPFAIATAAFMRTGPLLRNPFPRRAGSGLEPGSAASTSSTD
jgi:uncharacterized protein (TIGR00369 family)